MIRRGRKGNARVIYNGFESKEAVTGVSLNIEGISGDFSIRDSKVWQEPWHLSRGGLAISKDKNMYIAPYLAKVFMIESNGDGWKDPVEIASKFDDNYQKKSVYDISAKEAYLWNPSDLAVSDNGDIFITETFNGDVKKLSTRK